jgi:hypothetical protein
MDGVSITPPNAHKTDTNRACIMAGDKIPSVYALDKPEPLDELLKKDRGEDCLPCKVVGMDAFSLVVRHRRT